MSTADLRFYISIFLGRLRYFAVIATSITVIGILVAYSVPPVYRADATILVEAPKIPNELARSTIPEEIAKQLSRIKLEVLSRDNLSTLARRLGLYQDAPELSADEIAQDVRSNISVDPVHLDGSGKGTFGLSISFSSPDPVLAANLVNQLVETMIQRNVDLRTGQAGDTLHFFEQEVQRQSARLQEIESKIVDFKKVHENTLPENAAFRQSQQISLQERLLQISREEAALHDEQLRNEQMALLNSSKATEGLSLKQQTLEQFWRVLIDKRAIYSETSPAIVAIMSQIASLEKEIESDRARVPEGGSKSTPPEVGLRLAEISRKLELIPHEKEAIQKRLVELGESISKAPATETELRALEREYQNTQAQHSAATARLADALIGAQIEARSKGERLSVLEQATPPRQPTEQKRRLIAAGGLALGVGLGGGLIVIMELLNNVVRRPKDLISKLEIEPLATIPLIVGGDRPRPIKLMGSQHSTKTIFENRPPPQRGESDSGGRQRNVALADIVQKGL
ncbi:lipopolysaccharide biosynthesis protein [Microvirga sp. 0TCS3.31]